MALSSNTISKICQKPVKLNFKVEKTFLNVCVSYLCRMFITIYWYYIGLILKDEQFTHNLITQHSTPV